MGVNKVVFAGKTILDLTGATATAEQILSGYSAYGSNGEKITGTASGDRLKLRVLGGMTAPANPQENDIWVQTDVAVSGWEFSAIQNPTWAVVAGFVYFTSTYSDAFAFRNSEGLNFLNQHAIYTKLLGCYQYNGSAWSKKYAWIYHGSQWYQFSSAWDGHLFNYGNTYSSITGGWVTRNIAHTTDQYGPYNAAPSVQTQSNGGVKVYMSNTDKSGIWTTANKVSLAGFNTLTFNGNLYDPHGWNRAQLDVWSDFGTYSSENVVARLNATYNAGTYTLDISSLTGSYYIGVRTDFDGYAIVNEIKLS